MKTKRIAQSAFFRLCILLGLIVFFAGALLALFAAGSPQALTRDRTRRARELHRANPPPVAPAAGVYEAWVARYNGPANGYDEARTIALDNSGNVYVGGYSWGSGTGTDYTTVKYNSVGNEGWVTRYNGPVNGDDQLNAIAVDGSGNVYVTGFSVVDNNSHFDCATIKYNSAGQEQWVAHYTAPSGYAAGGAIALDGSGNVYVAAEAAIPNDPNTRFCVTIKYNAAGEEQWVSEYDGGMNNNQPAAIAVDSATNVYVTGHIRACPADDYLTLKYDSAGQEQWVARYQGPGTGGDSANALAVDDSGNVYVAGTSYTSGISSSTIKYNSAGQQQWVARYDQGGYDEAHALAIDGSGNVYVTGAIADPNAYPDYGTIKYNAAGQQQWMARYSAPSANSFDSANAIAVDAGGNVYVTGRSAGPGIYSYPDYATIKYDSTGQQQWVVRYNGPGDTDDQAVAIAVDKLGNVYVTGTSNGDYVTIKYGQGASPTPTVTPTPTPTPTPTFTPTPSMTPSPSPTPTPPECSPWPCSTPSPTPTPTATPVQTCCQHLTTSGTGTIVPGTVDIGNHCDNCLTIVTFPFPVQFYDSSITQAYVNSNGSLQLRGDAAHFGTSCPLPDYCQDAAIFAYQDDLRTDGPGDGVFTSISGTAPNRVFNIEWRTTYFGRPGTANFEVRFYENQSFFEIVYGVSTENGASAGSGVQQNTLAGACNATTFSCQTPTLTNGLKVTYQSYPCGGTPPPTPTPTPCTGRCTPTPRPRPTPWPRP
jgi:Beta-propeller repeat